jgi:hypothetical protein
LEGNQAARQLRGKDFEYLVVVFGLHYFFGLHAALVELGKDEEYFAGLLGVEQNKYRCSMGLAVPTPHGERREPIQAPRGADGA